MTRIIIADDHKMIAEGLVSLLDDVEEIEIVKCASGGQEVIDYLSKDPADLVIMDINMPDMDGIETTKNVKKKYPAVKVLILSMHKKEGYVKNAVEAGADGYILKNTGKKELIIAIEHIMNGNTYFAQAVTQTLVKKMRLFGEDEGITLSAKEKQILQLLSDGHTSTEIAERIALSQSTVETYRKNLLLKFEAKNVTEMIKKSLMDGYIM